MGYYIQAPTNHNKADYIVRHFGGTEIHCPANFNQIPPDKALIVVKENLETFVKTYQTLGRTGSCC